MVQENTELSDVSHLNNETCNENSMSTEKNSSLDSSAKNKVPHKAVTSSQAGVESGSGSKRVAVQSDSVASPKRLRSEEREVLDLATVMGFKPGDRVEVRWEISQDDGDEREEPVPEKELTGEKTVTRWWGATLLEPDGRTEDSVAIRVLDCDPFPEGGFPERSKEDVIFIGSDVLADPASQQELQFRREGEDEAQWFGREDVEELVNNALMNAMNKNSRSWNNLDRAKQATIAQLVSQKKEKLMQLLLNRPNGVVSSADMQSILADTMKD